MNYVRVNSLVICVLAAVGLFAQGTTSRLIGTIHDSTGAAIPGAAVQLTNEGTGVVFQTTTSASGNYVFEALQSGRYTLTVEAQGFKKFASTGNEVTIGQPTTVNVALEI